MSELTAKRIVLTVINDLNYDQRMIRICNSLVDEGYKVTLVGRENPKSKPLEKRRFHQKRIKVNRASGKMMYFIYWVKLFFYLLQKKADVFCATDLDSILSVYFASIIKGTKRVYDGHELFTEMKEVVTRPKEKAMWEWIERFTLPRFPIGYTIGDYYAGYFQKKYGLNYEVIRNATVLKPLIREEPEEPFILYQGAVNEGRCFEELIPAMQFVNHRLVVCGDGNFYQKAIDLANKYNVTDRIVFKGYVNVQELSNYTKKAHVGITLFDAYGLSNELSLANRYFDYMHFAVPQLAMDYPEYKKINNEFEIAYLIPKPTIELISEGLNKLMGDPIYHQKLKENTWKAREKYCWQNEEKKLIKFYKTHFPD